MDGEGSTWTNTLYLDVGMVGQGTLTISSAGTVSAPSLNLGSQGVIDIDGGKLSIGSSGSTAGTFNWRSGTLHYTGNASVGNGWIGIGADGFLILATPGKTLEVGGTFTVGTGQALILKGGQVKAGTLTLGGGTILAAGGIDLSGAGNLSGHGAVSGAVSGGTGKSITASGGNLSLGDINSGNGFDFDGTLDIGSSQVVLLSAGEARLGTSTILGDSGRLSAVNGARLDSGGTLGYTGNASIDGNFTHNGVISGSGGALTFLDDVTGAGSFAGDIVFKGGHNPGNSPATQDFNGANVTYDTTSVLTLEILDINPGTGYDQLVDIGELTFEGRLQLVFGDGYVPGEESEFALFEFDSFVGSFAPDRIEVVGFDRQRLDFTHLATDGRLSVIAVPVPEPESWILLFAGLGLVGWSARRRRTN